MKRFLLIFFFVFSIGMLSLIVPCQSAEPSSNNWLYVTTDTDGISTYLYLPDLIKSRREYVENSMIRYFKIWQWRNSTIGGYILSLQEYDIIGDKISSEKYIHYGKDGAILESIDYPYKEWNNLVPESVGKQKFEIVKAWITHQR